MVPVRIDLAIFAALLCSLSAPAPAPAQRASATMSFDQAVDLGDRTPEVAGARRGLEARAAAEASIGGAWQDTSGVLMPGGARGPGGDAGFELQANVVQGWALTGLGGKRRQAARAERAELSVSIRAQALRSRLEAARAWIELRTMERVEAVVSEREPLAAALVATTRRAVDAGVLTRAELAEAEAALAELRAERLEIHGARFEAAIALARATGDSLDPTSHVPPVETAGPSPAPALPGMALVRARLAAIDELPQVAVHRLASAAARAREVEAAASAGTILQVGAQIERTADDSWIGYGIVGFTRQPRDQAQRDIGKERAAALRATGDAEAAVVQARAELAQAIHDLEHAGETLALLESEVLPALIKARGQRERGLDAGQGTVFQLMQARSRELAAVTALERARGVKSWAEIRLWLLLAELEPRDVE